MDENERQQATVSAYKMRWVAAGRCYTCGKPRVTAFHCARHAAVNRATVRAVRARRKAEGRCLWCGREPLATPSLCQACAEKSRENNRRRRARSKAVLP